MSILVDEPHGLDSHATTSLLTTQATNAYGDVSLVLVWECRCGAIWQDREAWAYGPGLGLIPEQRARKQHRPNRVEG